MILVFDLLRIFENGFNVIKYDHQDLNITDEIATKELIGNSGAQVVINAAGLVSIVGCEQNPGIAFGVNSTGACNVAKSAQSIGARIVYISTGYVFDGRQIPSYSENDQVNPINIYGASKLAGEFATKISNPNHYIIRTGWLFGIYKSKNGPNFISTIFEKTALGEVFKPFIDVFGSPTYTLDLVLKIKELILKEAPFGAYHVVNYGACSKYDLTRKTVELTGLKINMEGNEFSGFSGVKIPRNSSLESKKLEKIGIEKLRPWGEALKDYLGEAQYLK